MNFVVCPECGERDAVEPPEMGDRERLQCGHTAAITDEITYTPAPPPASFERYLVRVPYRHSDHCWSSDQETEVEVYAKSDEHARHLAKRAVEDVVSVSETYSTEIVERGPP